jgi:coenzyme PQQ precursor peptide PqqA
VAIEYNRRSIHVKKATKVMCIKILSNIKRGLTMRTWKKPIVVEIAVGMEINCYVCAEL